MKKIICMIMALSLFLLSFYLLCSCSSKDTETTKANTVTVTFDKNDEIIFENGVPVKGVSFSANVNQTKTVNKGSYVSPPANPSTIGLPSPLGTTCIFGGWYKEPSCENAFDFNGETVNTNMTLYAKWIRVKN